MPKDKGSREASGRGSRRGPKGHALGILLSVVAAASFGTVAPIAKFAFDDGADPLALLATRFAIAAVLLFAFVAVRKRKIWLGRKVTLRLAALGAIGYAFESSLFFLALDKAPAGIVSLVFFSYPLITTMLSFALGVEVVRRSTVVALVLGSIGVATIFNIEGVNIAGPLLSLAAATAVSVYFITASRWAKDVEPSVAAAWTAVGAAASLLIVAPLVGHGLPPEAYDNAVAIGAVTTVAFTALYGALALIGTSRSAVAQMLEPVVTVVLAAIFLGEVITGRVAFGALLVVSALPILASTTHKEEVPPAADSL